MSFNDEYIPQIDGDVASPPSKSIMQTEFQCVTCKKAFYSNEELDEHDSWIFCCELCHICFNTEIEAGLHKLDVHPEDHTRIYQNSICQWPYLSTFITFPVFYCITTLRCYNRKKNTVNTLQSSAVI